MTGPLQVRLGAVPVNKISQKLLILRYSTPNGFARRPRTLLEYAFWKATEFRTFLLYTGPIILKNILPRELYSYFLLFHSAVTILISESHIQIETNVDSAHEMLQLFVKDFARIYGKEQVSPNVNNLLHICSDAKKYGTLDKFSAFRFEIYMSKIKVMIQKVDNPLKQIARRYAEVEAAEKDIVEMETLQKSHFTTEPNLQQSRSNGPLSKDFIYFAKQYKIYNNESFSIDCNTFKDNCLLLKNGNFASISNIVQSQNNEIRFVGKELLPYENIVRILNSLQYSWPLQEVKSKVWNVPCQKERIVIPLLHDF